MYLSFLKVTITLIFSCTNFFSDKVLMLFQNFEDFLYSIMPFLTVVSVFTCIRKVIMEENFKFCDFILEVISVEMSSSLNKR